MGQTHRFVLALVAGLAALTVVAGWLVTDTTRSWFERDLSLRAQLAVSGARHGLSDRWRRGERAAVRELLTDLARDERIMSAAACGVDQRPLATALEMSAGEQAERMRVMRAFVSEFNVYRWAGRMLLDAAQLRQRDRLTGRLAERVLRPVGAA